MQRSEEDFQLLHERLLRQFPGEGDELIRALAEDPTPSIRCHPNKGRLPQGAVASQIPWSVHGHYLDHRPAYAQDPHYHAGAYYPQDASSMLIEPLLKSILDTQEVNYVLDLCAAPGGKSTHILSLLPPAATLVSNEPFGQRYAILKENLLRWGIPQYITTKTQPNKLKACGPIFDVIMVDAPCSGEGLLRKTSQRQDASQSWDVQQCVRTQQMILEHAHDLLRPGGHILYSTCTMNPDENERRVEHFIARHGYTSVHSPELEAYGVLPAALPSGTVGGYYALPHRLRGESFYVACLRHPERSDKSPKLHHSRMMKSLGHMDDLAQRWMKEDTHFIGSTSMMTLYGHLQKLGIRAELPAYAIEKGKTVLPEHFAAMTQGFHPDLPAVEVTRETALSYLRHQPLELDIRDKGWYLLQFEGVGLGFIKYDGRRMINKYPMKWRLRQ